MKKGSFLPSKRANRTSIRSAGLVRHPVTMLIALILVTAFAANFIADRSTAQKSEGPIPVSVDKISPEAAQQIAALLQEKESRTPVQRKIDSQILYQIKMNRGQAVAEGVPTLETGLAIDDRGGLEVDVRADVTPQLLETLAGAGAVIVDSLPQYRSVLVRMPIEQIEAIAALPEVHFIMPNARANVWQAASPANDVEPPVQTDLFRTQGTQLPFLGQTPARQGFEQRAQRVKDYLRSQFTPQVGSQQSQGDATHQANAVRTTLGPDGTGVKIGVLSNGVPSLAASQALGDLGPVTVLPGQVGTGDEGTAMLEIVHDIAPGAQLFFATANPTPARFAQNIRDLRAAGCDIIIDDVFYFVESPFQDGQVSSIISNSNGGQVTQAVNEVTADGAMYFSSAGNQGNQDDNTASCYQGDWADGGVLAGAPGGNVHDFGGGAQSDLIQTGSGNRIDLYWADPLGGSANDYDLYILNNALTTVVASSTNVQSGSIDPFEEVSTGNTTNNRVVVLKKTGAANRFFHITINANGVGKLGTSTNGTTKGHSISANAYSVAATPAAAPGPFPNPFTGANVSETFTSDGPRRIFFNASGTAFTPGDSSSTGGIVRQKPDITAADRVSVTGVGGFPTTFSGTSAAAPHAGAIAALLKSAQPYPSNAQIRTALTSTALDIEAPGVDRNTGVGIIMPLPAMASLGQTAQAVLNKAAETVTEAPGFSDGDGQIERNERATLSIPSLTNVGPLAAAGVSVSLSSTTAGVKVITGGPSSPVTYGTIAPAGSGNASGTYSFALTNGYVCSRPIEFVMSISFNDGSARTQILKFTVNTAATFSVNTTIDATPAPANPFYTAVTGTQTNRPTRDGKASTCGDPKLVFPGVTAATNPRFDAFTFTAANSGCTTVTLTDQVFSAGQTQIFVVLYSNTFVPGSIGTNYVADSGSSPASGGTVSFTFNALAGQQYVAVVSEVPGTTIDSNYTLSITGPASTTCNVPVNSRADFDNDGKSDLSVFRPSDTNWYIYSPTSGLTIQNWGISGDIQTPGDFDGDGKTDIGIYRPSSGQWFFIRSSDNVVNVISFGGAADKPVAGDYDGDGKTDQAVYRPSTGQWFIFRSSTSTTEIVSWGNASDLAVQGDYDDDGKTDEAVFRPSTNQWFIFRSSAGPMVASYGVLGDKPVPADYDGDGKDDIAVFRPSDGNWYIFRSTTNTTQVTAWGTSTDVPVPADYDGDSKDDVAIYRNGTWLINRSTAGFLSASFGVSSDVPIPTKYIP